MSNYNIKEILQVFGQNIRFARKKRNFTIKDLAQKAKYSRIDLSKIEYGEKDIQLNTAIKLARAIDIPLPDLFSRNYVDMYEQIPEQDKPVFKEDDFCLFFQQTFEQHYAHYTETKFHFIPKLEWTQLL